MLAEICNSVHLDKEVISFREIHQRFSLTTGGEKLKKNVRWSAFQPLSVSNSEHQRPFGADANNLEHCRLIYGLTRWAIQIQNSSSYPTKFNLDDQEILDLAGLTHDYPEGLTEKGDVNFKVKTKQDEQNELKLVIPIITGLIGDSYEALELAKQVKNCLGDTSSRLGRFFNSIENIGYLRAALIVWPQIDTINHRHMSRSFKLINHDVLSNNIPSLISYSKDYYPVYKYLSDRKQIITQIFNTPESYFYGHLNTDQSSSDNFHFAKELWGLWSQKSE